MQKKNIDSRRLVRCGWLTQDSSYIKYHDEEWGKPVYDSVKLFEMLCLEGQQAGLSWKIILDKRDNYRKLFHNFDPYKIVQMSDSEILTLSNNSGIVRHKAKIKSIINNAKAYIDLERDGIVFSDFIWSFVDHKPILNFWKTNTLPTETEISSKMAKTLKKYNFSFVGSTTCYAFMQACGLVNDHIVGCCARSE